MMLRISAAILASVFTLLGASCCCTSDPVAPGLRPLPAFQELPAAEVEYSK